MGRSMRRNAEGELGEAGFTLIELIVAITMMVIIVGASVSLLITSFRSQPKISADANRVGTARVAMNKLINEIRQGVVGSVTTPVNSTPTGQLELETYVDTACGATGPQGLCKVIYSCATSASLEAPGNGICTRRTEATNGSLGNLETVASGISNPTQVFRGMQAASNCPGASTAQVTTFVAVTLAFPGADSGETSTTLSDGAGLRSCS